MIQTPLSRGRPAAFPLVATGTNTAKEETLPHYGDEELLGTARKYVKDCRFVLSQAACIGRILQTGTGFQKMNARAAHAGVCHVRVIDRIARKKIGAPAHSRLFNNITRFFRYISSQVFTMVFQHSTPTASASPRATSGCRSARSPREARWSEAGWQPAS